MHCQESLGLLRRFESTHAPFSNSRWLMRKFCPVVGIPRCIMNRIWNQLAMCDAVASQFVRHNLPGFTTMCFQQSSEESLSGFAVASTLQKDIDDFSVLIDSAPQVVLYTAYRHEYFIDEKCIAETLMTTLKPLRIFGAKLVTPQTNRFITYDNTACSQQIFNIPVA